MVTGTVFDMNTEEQQTGSITVESRQDVLLGRIRGGPHGELLPGVVADLDGLVTRAETEAGVRAVVLTSDHPTRFIAHADIRWLQEVGAVNHDLSPRAAQVVVELIIDGRGLTPEDALEIGVVDEVVDRTRCCIVR